MKWPVAMALARLVAVLLAVVCGHGARLAETPIAKVVSILEEMQATIEADGHAEQASYEKYSSWCNQTLNQKAEDISNGKEKIEELQTAIEKNTAFLASSAANVVQLKKEIAENVKSQKEADAVRKSELAEYEEQRKEAETSMEALESAMGVMKDAGKGKTGFLAQAKLLSVVGSMRSVLVTPVAREAVKDTDLQAVERFVASPEDYLKKRTTQSALQMQQNPHGDYAPAGDQIFGILGALHDGFKADIEKSTAADAAKQQAFDELQGIKNTQAPLLEHQLRDEMKAQAEKTKKVADDKAMRDDTKDQVDADETFFAQTKESCKTKAKQWAERSDARTQELAGVTEAIGILNSDALLKHSETPQQKMLQLSL